MPAVTLAAEIATDEALGMVAGVNVPLTLAVPRPTPDLNSAEQATDLLPLALWLTVIYLVASVFVLPALTPDRKSVV